MKKIISILLFCLFLVGCTDFEYTEKVEISKDDFIASCVEHTYDDLARYPDKYKNDHVKFKGKVMQVLESGNNYIEMRINVTQGKYSWDDTIYCAYNYSNDEAKILEDDIITFYGTYNGTVTYTAVLGNKITVPCVIIQFIDR